jgi:hypothetical protein
MCGLLIRKNKQKTAHSGRKAFHSPRLALQSAHDVRFSAEKSPHAGEGMRA